MKLAIESDGEGFELHSGSMAGEDGKVSRLSVTPVYNSYWRFAAERQKVFRKRLFSEVSPWTSDPIICGYKFTNAYRASDRVSQYLIRNVIYRSDLCDSHEEVVFRILLFKFFNKIETWQLLERELGQVSYRDYKFETYDKVLSQAMRGGGRIYSAAYIMPPGSSAFGYSAKHQNHLKLLERMMEQKLPEILRKLPNMQQAFELIRSYPTIGNFLAYQFVTDINYSEVTGFSEMEFVVPGPGALDGLRKCFGDGGGLGGEHLIRLMAENQQYEFDRLEINFESLWGRPLQLIDCQNLFCEVDKYSRVAHPDISGVSGRTRIKQKFNPTASLDMPWYPPKWGINDRVLAEFNTLGRSRDPKVCGDSQGLLNWES